MNTSSLFRLNVQDFFKGAVTAVFAAIVFTVAGVVSTAGFNVFTADWASILQTALNAGIAAFVGYIGKNFLSDSNGNVLGVGTPKE